MPLPKNRRPVTPHTLMLRADIDFNTEVCAHNISLEINRVKQVIQRALRVHEHLRTRYGKIEDIVTGPYRAFSPDPVYSAAIGEILDIEYMIHGQKTELLDLINNELELIRDDLQAELARPRAELRYCDLRYQDLCIWTVEKYAQRVCRQMRECSQVVTRLARENHWDLRGKGCDPQNSPVTARGRRGFERVLDLQKLDDLMAERLKYEHIFGWMEVVDDWLQVYNGEEEDADEDGDGNESAGEDTDGDADAEDDTDEDMEEE